MFDDWKPTRRLVDRALALTLVTAALRNVPGQAQSAPQQNLRLFPNDSGILNVRDFGATGDGVADDTQAILNAIAKLPPYSRAHPYLIRIIYFPAGIYRVTDSILRKVDNQFLPNLVMIGDDQETTTIRLADGASGFADPEKPKAVLYTTSGLAYMKNPYDGGRRYPERGEGNEAFGNTIENITVDVGHGNPGAIGIDFLSNNVGTLRKVRIRTSGRAATGLSMIRRWPGPSLIEDVSIEGFDVGIDIDHTLYSLTIENVSISRARQYGLRNNSNVVSFHQLRIAMDGGYGLANLNPDGLITGIGATISGAGVAAVINRGALNLKNADARNFKGQLAVNRQLDGVFQAEKKISDPQWRLPIRPTPQPSPLPTRDWTSVAKFGARPDVDSTAAFTAAFQSNAKVLYIPNGIYSVSAPLVVNDEIERIEGMYSVINIGNDPRATEGRPSPLFRTSPDRRKPLFIRRLVVERRGNMSYLVDHRANVDIVLTDIVCLLGAGLVYRTAEGGPIFANNTTAGRTEISGPSPAWFRQYNAEGPTIRMTNKGSPVWILGAKSEQTNTLVRCVDGGNTEVVGGFIARVFPTLPERPAFQAVNARLVLSYAEDVYRPDAIYRVHLEAAKGDRQVTIPAENLLRRGKWARMVPSLSTDTLDFDAKP